MKSRSQYRIYPTDQQQRSLARLFGCVRVAWNDALGLCKQSEKLPKNSDLQKLCITQAKQIKERAWLSKVSNIPPATIHSGSRSGIQKFLSEIRPAIYPSVGIDLGIKTFAVLSTGEKIESPDYSPLDQKTRRFQRRLAKRVNGSKRREVMRLKIAKLKAKEQDTRKDFLHKLSTRVVNDNQVIALENLNISGMLKNRYFGKAQ